MKPLLRALCVGLLAACESTAPEERLFDDARLYSRQVFSTPAECVVAQTLGINCTQDAWFCPSGRAVLMLTDILNPGVYEIRRDTVAMSFPANPETPSEVLFVLGEGESTLREVASNRIWTRDLSGEAAQLCD